MDQERKSIHLQLLVNTPKPDKYNMSENFLDILLRGGFEDIFLEESRVYGCMQIDPSLISITIWSPRIENYEPGGPWYC